MLDLLPHLAKARYLPDLAPDVAYAVRPSFFYGSSRKGQPGELRDKSVVLTNPACTRRQQALGLAIEGRESQLVRYYQEVLRVMQQHRKELPANRHYFALQPVLQSKGQTHISFPWYDTYPEAAGLLRALQQPDEEGVLFDDLDQGWQVVVYARGERVYLAEGDGDGPRPHNLCCTDRARLARLAAAALERTRRQLTLLVQQTGQNPWRFVQ